MTAVIIKSSKKRVMSGSPGAKLWDETSTESDPEDGVSKEKSEGEDWRLVELKKVLYVHSLMSNIRIYV